MAVSDSLSSAVVPEVDPSINRVTIHIPWHDPDELAEWLRDVRRLFGVHPALRVEAWQIDPEPLLKPGCRVRLVGFAEQIDHRLVRSFRVESLSNGWLFKDDGGWLESFEITWEAHPQQGSALTLKERYRLSDGDPVAEAERQLESRHGLIPWSGAIRSHLRWRRFLGGWFVGRRLLDWFATLAPSHRRIARLLGWSTLLDLLLLGLALLFWRPV